MHAGGNVFYGNCWASCWELPPKIKMAAAASLSATATMKPRVAIWSPAASDIRLDTVVAPHGEPIRRWCQLSNVVLRPLFDIIQELIKTKTNT